MTTLTRACEYLGGLKMGESFGNLVADGITLHRPGRLINVARPRRSSYPWVSTAGAFLCDPGSSSLRSTRNATRPEWTREECDILLDSPQVTDEELSNHLPRRGVGAMQTVRSFMHNLHQGGDISGLSLTMRQAIDERRGTVTCPKCGAIF